MNRELILLYWQIGRDIIQRQQEEGWGAKVIDRLSADLRREFPDIKGFFFAKPQVHERVCTSISGRGNCAGGACTNYLVSHGHAA
ncbi:DUF1016 N-terminal domain-containing protein [Methanoculleus chikugoensis]|uniref:DUF1016 N-terminal domain-containing protein n=1 Tax=Methanoculleus chikugoensis TaxID=118126 RepID=UPI002116A507|nr:DUF1016 N-terminal domain-containing protein [Methanoculleus chikugoensis]